jgi:thioesterase domain-containing protein/acyl carrier protein
MMTLPLYMVPSALYVVDGLPLKADGEIDRDALSNSTLGRMTTGTDFVSPRDSYEVQLVEIFENVLGRQPIGIKDNFFDLRVDSLLAVHLFAQIQRLFGRELPLSILFEAGTVENLAEVLRTQTETKRVDPLVQIQQGDHSVPFFCVHPGSGLVLAYAQLAKHMGTDQSFYALQDPAIYSASVPQLSIEQMAANYLEAVRRVQPAGPYLLGGWSFGGYVSFEMAQQLHSRGERVDLLALFDTPAPGSEANELMDADDAKLLAILAARATPEKVENLAASLRGLGTEEQLQYIYHYINDQSRFERFNLNFVRRQLEIFRSRITAVQSYCPQVYAGQITLFRASDELDNQTGGLPDLTLGWESLSSLPIEPRIVPGNHDTMALAPHAETLAKEILTCIHNAPE